MSRSSALMAGMSLLFALAIAGCADDRSPVTPDVATTDASDASALARGHDGHDDLDDDSAGHGPSAVYTMSNDAGANEIITFVRGEDGSLEIGDRIATGGAGTGAGLGNQGGLRATTVRGRHYLFAVNAGSDQISVLEVDRDGTHLLETVDSGGDRPISIAVSDATVYVLHAGSVENVTGFRFERGRLAALGESTRPLSGTGVGPAQVEFSPRGDLLVVTEKATNQIVTYRVDRSGRAGDPIVNASSGQTPFGFSFDRNGSALVVSEAFGGSSGGSAVSSYQVRRDGSLDVVTASLASGQTAACWIEFAGRDRYAYTTNAGTGTITGYAVDARTGALAQLDADGVTADTGTGSGPIDLAAAGRRGEFLYVLNGRIGQIAGYAVGDDGSLSLVDTADGLAAGANGLAAW